MPYCIYQMRWNSLEMGQRSSEPPPCFRNPKVWSKAITVRSNNTAIGWIFNQLLSCTFSGPAEGNFRILPPRSGIRVHTQYVTPPESKSFTHRPGLPGFLQQRKCDGTDKRMVVGLPFSVNVRAFPKGTQSGQIAIEK